MQDYIDQFAPGSFDLTNAAEVLAVVLGAFLILEGRVELGLTLVAIGVGAENWRDLRDDNEP